MGKRSDFARNPRDLYPTPEAAVFPLLPHLVPNTSFIEPCAGDGRLVRHLEKYGHICLDAFDIEPLDTRVEQDDALEVVWPDPARDEVCLTNPPWRRDFLHPFIEHWRVQMPTWVLCDADWVHTKQAAPFLPYCRKIVSVGRVKWIEGSKHTGKDNAAWMLFTKDAGDTLFFGR